MEENKRKDFIRASLGLATAQICQGLGWHSVQRSSHDILTDVLERYLCQVSKTAVIISQTCSRTIPNLDDVTLAFKQLGIQFHELQDYMQQVEASPAIKLCPPFPLKPESPKSLLDFSGEDNLPPLVDITIKEEVTAEEVKQEESKDEPSNSKGEVDKDERPKDLSFRTDSIESPPYSPLEPKSLNLNAFNSVDLTRPDLKVTTPKGYTPTLTTPSLVTGIASLTNSIAKPSPNKERSRTPLQPKHSKSETKTNKKEKKDTNGTITSKTRSPKTNLLSPPSVKSNASNDSVSPKFPKSSRSPSPSPAVKEKEREKEKEKQREKQLEKEREKEKEKQREKEKEKEREKEKQKERDREREREREKERQLEKERELEEEPDIFDGIPPPSPPPFLLHKPSDSPSSTLFSPPRMRIASYQSDKKKPAKEKSKESSHKKDTPDKLKDDHKKSKQKKKSSTLTSPSSSVGSLKSPSIKTDTFSPPTLSQPIIKQEKNSSKTVIFPSDISSSDRNSPINDHSPKGQDGGFTIKQEKKEKEESNTSFSSYHKRDIKVEPLEQRHGTDMSENEVDVTSLSQGEETNYTETFQPNMFFPTKFGDDKKKKKKKNKDKDRDRDDKNKKRDGKNRKRKHESSSSTVIPKLTLKMGAETILDQPPPKMAKQRLGSPFSSLESTLTPSASEIIKKKKEKKHKQKEKDREKQKDKEKESKSGGGLYVETLADTAAPYGGEVYYCPGCGAPDDGSPMIGCDSCDGWYHWPCVDIVEEPAEDEKWFCPNCPSGKKKKKKKKKDNV